MPRRYRPIISTIHHQFAGAHGFDKHRGCNDDNDPIYLVEAILPVHICTYTVAEPADMPVLVVGSEIDTEAATANMGN